MIITPTLEYHIFERNLFLRKERSEAIELKLNQIKLMIHHPQPGFAVDIGVLQLSKSLQLNFAVVVIDYIVF